MEELPQIPGRFDWVYRVVLQHGVLKRIGMQREGVADGARAAFVPALVAAEHGVELQRGGNQHRQVQAFEFRVVAQMSDRAVQIEELP